MGLLVITALGTMIGTLLALEAKAWVPYVSRKLVHSTLNRMPDRLDEDLRSRWTEEIEADLDSYKDRPFGGLAFAVRLRSRGGRRLAAEFALQNTLSNPKSVADSELSSRRPFRFALKSGDGHQVIYLTYANGTFTRQELDAEGNVLHFSDGETESLLRSHLEREEVSWDPPDLPE